MRVAIVVAVACLSAVGLCAGQDVKASIKQSTNIPAQDLGPALKTLAYERGFQLMFRADVVEAKHTHGAVGNLTTTEALTRLLEGTSLVFSYLNDKTVTILPANSNNKLDQQGPSAGNSPRCSGISSNKLGYATSLNQTGSAGVSDCVESYSYQSQVLAEAIVGGDSDRTQDANPAAGAPGEPTDTTTHVKPEDTLDEVIVTAQFREQNQQQTPIAISTISGATMEAKNLSSVVDIATTAPNVTLSQASGNYGPSVQAYIRGVGQYDSNVAFEPGVGIYVDDVYHGQMLASMFDLLDLDRAEVLRGPQGTLAGKNSLGGAVKLYSVKPTGEGGYAEVAYGSYNRVNAKAVGDFTVVPDQLFVRVSAVTKKADGFFTRYDYKCQHPGSALPTLTVNSNCVLGTEGGQDLDAARIAVRWLVSDAIENNANIDITSDKSETPAKKLTYANNPAATLYGVPFNSQLLTAPNSYSSYATYLAYSGNSVSYALPPIDSTIARNLSDILDVRLAHNLSLKLISGIQDSYGEYTDSGSASPIDIVSLDYTYRIRQYTQELRLSGQSLADMINWTLGGFYYRARETSGGRLDIPLAGVSDIEDNKVSADSESAFAHGEFKLAPKLQLIGGARYTKESKDFQYGITNTDGTPNALNGAIGHYSGSRFDYRAGVQYQWTPDVMSYAEVSTGFKGGGVNPRAIYASEIRPFNPETLTAYEVGIKSDLFEHRARVNISAFYNQYDGLQLQVTSCPQYAPTPTSACSLTINAGDARVWGAELETEWLPVNGVQLDGSVSYLNFKYKSLSPDAVDVGVTMGMTNPYSPKVKASLGAQYTALVGAAGSVTARADATYQSTIFTDSAVNTVFDRVDGYSLLNVHLTWDDQSKWEAALHINNLLDKFHYVSKSDLTGLGLATGDVGTPRTFLFSIKRRF